MTPVNPAIITPDPEALLDWSESWEDSEPCSDLWESGASWDQDYPPLQYRSL